MEDFAPPGRALLGPPPAWSPWPSLGNIHLVTSRPQPCRLVTMTSVIKTVYTLQPTCVLSSGLPAGGCPWGRHLALRTGPQGGRARSLEASNLLLGVGGTGKEGHSTGFDSLLTSLEPGCLVYNRSWGKGGKVEIWTCPTACFFNPNSAAFTN